jgi:hypothetical protein
MSEIDAFETRVQQQIKLLSSRDAKVRLKAAVWLGEAGEPIAITRLKQVYEGDPDPRVREAAAYSLGMFRALQYGMKSEDSDVVYDLLEDVQLRGKFGRRVPVPFGCIYRLMVALVVSLIVMLAFNFVIWPQFGPQLAALLGVQPEAGPPSRSAALDDLDQLLAGLRADAAALQAQYADPAALNCQAGFENPVAYDVSRIAADAELTAVAARLNAALVQFFTAKSVFIQACAQPEPALSAEHVAVPLGTLDSILAALPGIEADLNAARSAPARVDTAATELDAEANNGVTEVEGEAPAGETGVDQTPLNAHLTALFTIIDEARSPRGAAGALEQFWNGIGSSTLASGCTEPQPAIPGNYTLSEADAAALPDLNLAAELVNNGLALTRQGWQQVTAACAANDLMNNRESGLTLAQNARIAFDTAEAALQALRAGSG